MSYSKLLYEYTHPTNRWKDNFITISEKRLRWLKYEAYGNSKFHTTAFNIRHAHICNRNLQQNLGTKLAFYSNIHGKHCTEIELKQQKLWRDMQKRHQVVHHTVNLKSKKKKQLAEDVATATGVNNDATIKHVRHKPFSTYKDYTVFQHFEAHVKKPVEHIDQKSNDERVDLIRFDTKRQQEVRVLSTFRNNSLRSDHQIYGNSGISIDTGLR